MNSIGLTMMLVFFILSESNWYLYGGQNLTFLVVFLSFRGTKKKRKTDIFMQNQFLTNSILVKLQKI